MTEHNRAIRMAQKFLRAQADTFGGYENANREWEDSPYKGAFLVAAARLEALILEDDE